MARPLEESRASEFVIQIGDSSALARLRGRRPPTDRPIEGSLTRRQDTPTGLWLTLAGGMVIVIILLVVLAVT
ncbi:MAG: hypothetical protein A2V70_06705 [Planctomycetes bacterium RBG_13_63_9]|nr:MAG: hypothetical protein A2V70_06705 [Planctomycetes bacterium RBG_13_63_9]